MALPLSTASLERISKANPKVIVPSYDRSSITPGIVHLGVGNFHRAHQCVFVDDSLSLPGHEGWGYTGIGLMPFDSKMRDALKPQDTMYTLWEKGVSSSKVRVIGCHGDFTLAPDEPGKALNLLTADHTKIVTLTVTEKGYFVDFSTGKLNVDAAPVSSDIETLKNGGNALKTAAGFIVAAAKARMTNSKLGFTVLSCDNVQENGEKAEMAVHAMAGAVDSSIAAWIKENVKFPNSMVDRITPATTEEAKAQLASEYGIQDGWPVICESFLLWVVEDKFAQGRPDWDKSKSGKCIFVKDVVPYELMKLRLLNAVHQALSYPASLLGHELVHDAMADRRVSGFLKAYMAAAGKTVPEVKGLDKKEWCATVIDRFSNPAIRDTIYRLTEDATNRIAVALAPCLESDAVKGKSLRRDDLTSILLPVGCWIRCLLGADVGEFPAAARLNNYDRAASVKGPAANVWEAVKKSEGAEDAAVAFLKAAFGGKIARSEVAKGLVHIVETLQKPNGLEAAIRVASGEKPLRKPKFKEISAIVPEQKGVNFYGKVVKVLESAGDNRSTLVLGDSSGVVKVKVQTARATACVEGKTVRVQNARVIMVSGFVVVLVDKWAVLKEDEHDVGAVKLDKDISAVEYELTA